MCSRPPRQSAPPRANTAVGEVLKLPYYYHARPHTIVDTCSRALAMVIVVVVVLVMLRLTAAAAAGHAGRKDGGKVPL
jgi:hypothetical protein